MLLKLKDRFKHVSYYDNDDFLRIINKIAAVNKEPDSHLIYSIFLSIDSVVKSFVKEDKNVILLKINEKNISNVTKTHTIKYYNVLCNNKLIWIESYYVEKL
jgi:hypothetical protein